MSKIKLIDANYNEETGISYVKINTDYGEFEGFAKLHEEDRSIASKYAGCQYAEMRAVLKYMKHRIKILAHQIKALINCQKQMECRVAYNPNSVESRALRKQIYILIAERKDWQARYSSLKDRLCYSMNNRKEIVEKITADRKEVEE